MTTVALTSAPPSAGFFMYIFGSRSPASSRRKKYWNFRLIIPHPSLFQSRTNPGFIIRQFPVHEIRTALERWYHEKFSRCFPGGAFPSCLSLPRADSLILLPQRRPAGTILGGLLLFTVPYL